MKYIFVILAIVALAFAQKEKMRLIEMNGHRFWVHQDQIPNLQPKEGELVNFMDVTNTQNLETSGKVEEVVLPDKPTQQETVKPMMEKIEEHSESHLNSVVGHLQTYRTRGANSDTGVQAVQWMKAEYQKRLDSIPADRRSLFTVEYVNHTRWRQPSLIVKMKGKASNDQIVILGSHIDSTASGGVAPGADDDASGSASVLEAFTILAKYSNFTPSKSIEWHHYAAEEMGLLGSREIAQAYKARNAKVYAMMQLDMTGYNPRSTNKIGVITNGVDPALTAFSRKLITEYGKIGFVDRQLFGGTSDHASWRSAGYKACFPFEAVTNPNIHTARDTLSQLDMKNGIEWVKLAVSYMVELSHN